MDFDHNRLRMLANSFLTVATLGTLLAAVTLVVGR